MINLAIIGAGDLGEQVLNCAYLTGEFNIVGFFDDFKTKDSNFCEKPILGNIKDVCDVYSNNVFDQLFIAVGYNHLEFKKELFEKLNHKIPFATIIHPSCIIDPTVNIGKGTVVYAGCILDLNVEIKENVLLNINCTIAHDTVINSHSFISPSCSFAGFVTIGLQNMIGINSIFIDSVKTVDLVKTGGGTVVIKDLTTKGLYVGNPAKFIK